MKSNEHSYKVLSDECEVCGYRYGSTAVTPPCPGSSTIGMKWDELSRITDKLIGQIKPAKTCTCGSSAVGSPRHSDWCDMYVPDGVA